MKPTASQITTPVAEAHVHSSTVTLPIAVTVGLIIWGFRRRTTVLHGRTARVPAWTVLGTMTRLSINRWTPFVTFSENTTPGEPRRFVLSSDDV